MKNKTKNKMTDKIICNKCNTLMLHRDNTYIKVRAIWDYCPNCKNELNREVINLK